MNRNQREARQDDGFFIPSFSSPPSVAVLVLVGELFAIVLAVLNSGWQQFNWEWLGLISFFVLWVVLVSAVILQCLRPWLCLLSLASAGVVSYFLVLLVTILVSVLGQKMWLNVDFVIDQHARWRLFQHLLVAAVMVGISWRYFYIQFLLRRQQQAQLLAKVEALQARIKPHFLFNSMNSIASMIGTDPVAAEQSVEDLCDLFRASLNESLSRVSLREELELCRGYLRIEKCRMGDRLQVDWQLVGGLPALDLPSLIIQPLIENAVYHGIAPRIEGGCITIKIERKGGYCHIEVINPVATDEPSQHRGKRMALDNIQHRLRAIYDREGRLILTRQTACFSALLILPCRELAGG